MQLTKKELNQQIKTAAYTMTATKNTKELKAIFPELNFTKIESFATVVARMGRGRIETVKKGKKSVKVWVENGSAVVAPVVEEVKQETKANDSGVLPVAEAWHVITCLMDLHGNFTPIYKFRQHMKDFTREQQDNSLYALIANNKIEMSTLAEPLGYSNEEIESGIEQISGGSLFFISVE